MIYQQYQTAIKSSYSGKQDLQQQVSSARECREWLESLDIDVELRNSLVEPIQVLQQAFQELVSHTEQSM
jgi:hypothetical protein